MLQQELYFKLEALISRTKRNLECCKTATSKNIHMHATISVQRSLLKIKPTENVFILPPQ